MEKIAHDVLQKQMARITGSNVDPAELSVELLAAGIIGSNQMQQASFRGTLAGQRLGDLVLNMMRNGAPDTFEKFVRILLDRNDWKWLGKELKGTAYVLLLDPHNM